MIKGRIFLTHMVILVWKKIRISTILLIYVYHHQFLHGVKIVLITYLRTYIITGWYLYCHQTTFLLGLFPFFGVSYSSYGEFLFVHLCQWLICHINVVTKVIRPISLGDGTYIYHGYYSMSHSSIMSRCVIKLSNAKLVGLIQLKSGLE